MTGGENDQPLGDDQLNALDHLTERVLMVATALAARPAARRP